MVKVLFVCHGNICRSTMAESVMAHLVKESGADISVYSAATSYEEIGNPPHPGTVKALKNHGIPLVPHRAVRLRPEDYDKYDLLIGMDSANIRNMRNICGGDPEGKIRRLLDWTNERRDVDDPWYTGRFEDTYADVDKGCRALLKAVLDNRE